jgi:hypothetical protein
MMKHLGMLLIGAVFFASCGEQVTEEKRDSFLSEEIKPLVEFRPRGELVTGYDQVYSHTNRRNWVEVYLFTSNDSIIVTEIEKRSKESTEPPAIYCFEASRAQLDVNSLVALRYDAVKEPVGMQKVSMEVKDPNNMVVQWVSDPWQNDGKRDTIMVTGIRVLTKDEAQADEIMEKLRSGFRNP